MIDIEIVSISKNRQFGIDNKGNSYSLDKLKKAIRNGKTTNVYIRKACSKQASFPEIIVRKRIESISIDKVTKVNNINIKDELITFGDSNNRRVELIFITEDRGSASNIIKNIIQKFAYDNNLCIVCDFIHANGASNIPYVISNILNAKLYTCRNCIVCYDNAINNSSTLNEIGMCLSYIASYGYNVVSFTPFSSEECALSFGKLTDEIKGIELDNEAYDLLHTINNYLKSGDNYIKISLQKASIKIGCSIIKFPYSSKYIKRYKAINNLEQYLADRLAYITDRRPYEFIKSANLCWYKDCGQDPNNCTMTQAIGKLNPNSCADKCNHTLISRSKINVIINESLFGGIYDALSVIYGIPKRVLNDKIIKRLIKKY